VKRPINDTFEAFKKKVMSLYPKQLKFEESKRSALNGFAVHHSIKAPTDQKFDPKTFLLVVKQKAMEKLKPQTKVRLVLKARMEKIHPTDDSSIVEVMNFQSRTEIILEVTNLDELWIKMVKQILENISSVFQMNGSGWTFHSDVSLDIHTVRYRPLRGGTHVPLPKFLAVKEALNNMYFHSEKKNLEDNQCFKWCVARALNPVNKDSSRITKTLQEQAKELVFDGIEFPVSLKAITNFEKPNPEISMNVLGYKDEGKKLIFPLRISNVEDRRYEVNLLLLEDKHYVLIKSLSRLLTRQMSNHDGKRHFCLRCLNSFTKKKC